MWGVLHKPADKTGLRTFPLSSRCLQPAFPMLFPTLPHSVSRPYSRLFPEYFPDRFPHLFPTGNCFPSRPVPSRPTKKLCSPVPSRQQNGVPPSRPVPRANKREPFAIPSFAKTHKKFACGGRDGPIPYRAAADAPGAQAVGEHAPENTHTQKNTSCRKNDKSQKNMLDR